MTRIYIVRHAEAEGNLYRRIHGQYDSMVTPLGYRQIEALSRRFQDIPVDAVYSSDLYRTRMTAKAIYAPKGLPLHLEPGLREIAMGRWEDQTWGGAARRDPERMNQFSRSDPDYDSPGGRDLPGGAEAGGGYVPPPDPDPWGPDHRLCQPRRGYSDGDGGILRLFPGAVGSDSPQR